jgi:predicted transcriptional regulator
MGPREHVAFLAGSANRVRILETLREQPHRQCELTEACDLSRSTVHRTLDGLESRGWVEQANNEYRLTVGGDLVLGHYAALESAIDRVDEWGTFLNRLGDLATTLPLAALSEATLVTSTPENPHAAAAHLADGLATTTTEEFYAISAVVSPRFNEAAQELIATDTEMELIIDGSVLDTSSTDYEAALDDAYSLDNFTLYLSPDDLAFGLAIFDGRVLISAHDERGVLRECLDSTDETLRTWARGVYDDHRSAATRADAPVPKE